MSAAHLLVLGNQVSLLHASMFEDAERAKCAGETFCTCSDQAIAETGDACNVAGRHAGAAGIVSLFGLQQLPEPHLALANWVQALAPGAPSCNASQETSHRVISRCDDLVHTTCIRAVEVQQVHAL